MAYRLKSRVAAPDLTWPNANCDWDGGLLILTDVKSNAELARFDFVHVEDEGNGHATFTVDDGMITIEPSGKCSCGGSPPPIPTEQVPA